MKRISVVTFFLFTLFSCNRDHKTETVSNYIRYIWKIRAEQELALSEVREIKMIRGKDSLEIMLKAYTNGKGPLPALDTVLSNIAEDIAYNTGLLNKTNRKIDSLATLHKSMPDQSLMKDFIRTFVDLKNFTTTQLQELKYQKYMLTRYQQLQEEVLSREVFCKYKIRGHSSDTATRVISQTFYLSPDTRKIYLVR